MKKHYNFEDTKSFAIMFREDNSHQDVISQFVDGLVKNKFAKKKEIVENLKMADILIK